MKKVKFLILAIAFVIANGTSAQKMAHINLDSLLSIMPESKVARETAQEYYKQLENTVMTMQKELQDKYQDYMDKQATYTDLIKQTKEKELNDLNQRIQDFQQQAQADLQKKNDELSRPVYDKAKKAIDQVAKENGYKYVFDTGNGTVLYSDPSDDIFMLVKKKLNITDTKPATGSAPTQSTPAAPAKK